MIKWKEVPKGTPVSIRVFENGVVSYKVKPFSGFEYGLVFVEERKGVTASYRPIECRLDNHDDFVKYRVDYDTYIATKGETPKAEPVKVTKTIEEIASEIAALVDKKNADYNNSFEQLFNEYGWSAFNIRIADKLSRIKQLTKEGTDIKVKSESVQDTIKDIVGYSLLMLEVMERNGTK